MDTFTPEERSRIMRKIRSKDTRPEKIVRSLVHRLGYRFRLHRNDLPGKPDLTFPSKKKVIFVHGCFWHGHDCPRGSRIPKSNRDYWIEKIDKNKKRDTQHLKDLEELGWDALIIWECHLKDHESLIEMIVKFL